MVALAGRRRALAQLQADYASRGVNLVRIANKWTFRTAGDLSWLMTRESTETRRLSRAAIEMLAIIAYHQPVTRAEIEEIRGVITSKGTLDVLLETGWIRPRGRRKTPGCPLTFGTTEAFLSQFSLSGTDRPAGSGGAEGDGASRLTRGCLPASACRRRRTIRRSATTRIRSISAIWNWRWRRAVEPENGDGANFPSGGGDPRRAAHPY